MKETPLLMTPENVRKILDNLKWQTRRIVKPQPEWNEQSKDYLWSCHAVRSMVSITELREPKGWEGFAGSVCPYGQAGDRLWVRETWANPGEEGFLYRANPEHAELVEQWKKDPNCPQVKWNPSIHMPKWACRLWLDLVEVRVERLQAISEKDACAEGCGRYSVTPTYAQERYKTLWESIHGPGSWALNPWVWCLTFRRGEAPTTKDGAA